MHFLIFQQEAMLNLCWHFKESQPTYAYKWDAYKKELYGLNSYQHLPAAFVIVLLVVGHPTFTNVVSTVVVPSNWLVQIVLFSL